MSEINKIISNEENNEYRKKKEREKKNKLFYMKLTQPQTLNKKKYGIISKMEGNILIVIVKVKVKKVISLNIKTKRIPNILEERKEKSKELIFFMIFIQVLSCLVP